MSRVRQSLLLSLVDSYLGLVLQLASTVVISRLLTPAEVGVFAIAAVFAGLASTFRDFGVAEYLIQEREVTSQKIQAALALNIIVSWSVSIFLVVAASSVADFYKEPGIADVMRVQAISFLLIPFGAVTQAWFRRELNYRPIIICNAASSVAAFVASIALALNGFGYMSLAWSSLVGVAVVVLATAWFRPKSFPRWPSLVGMGTVFHFGKFASIIYIMAQVGKGAPELIIGRARGVADVGIFSRANGLIEMFNRLLLRPVLLICMPYFAGQDRERGSMAPAYLSSVSLLTAAGWPFLIAMGVMAFAAIRIVYGAQWVAAVPLAQILCLACAMELLFLPSREALLASGDARRASTLQAQIMVAQVLGLLAVFPFGLVGASWGLVAAAVVGVVLSQWHLRHIGLRTPALLAACGPSLVLGLLTGAPLAMAAWFIPIGESNFSVWAACGGCAAVLTWLSGLRLIRHPLWTEVASAAAKVRVRLRLG